MDLHQPGITAPVPPRSRHLSFNLLSDTDPATALQLLGTIAVDDGIVIGIGQSLLTILDKSIPGMHQMPALSGPGVDIPSTPTSLWCWLRDQDQGNLLHRSRRLQQDLFGHFALESVVDCFMHLDSRDLTGYEDGTENPEGDQAQAAAIAVDHGPGIGGSSFVAVQQWLHDLDHFLDLPESEQDDIIGRRRASNEEFAEAPASAHVKRAAQESFSPEAFMLRRSMPWVDGMEGGLVFTAFGKSLQAFEAVLNNMIGAEDGITDELFRFTRPMTGAYYWCPPVGDNRLDLRALA